MCSGVVKVMVLPLTEATSFTSLIGLPDRENQSSASGNGSSAGSEGLCLCQTARSVAQIVAVVGLPQRVGGLLQLPGREVCCSALSRYERPTAGPLAPVP